jgi:hypothetical protein
VWILDENVDLKRKIRLKNEKPFFIKEIKFRAVYLQIVFTTTQFKGILTFNFSTVHFKQILNLYRSIEQLKLVWYGLEDS